MCQKFKFIAALSAALALSCPSFAQQTEKTRNPEREYLAAVEWMDAEQYETARRAFSDFLKNNQDANSENNVNASYYHAYCTMQLFHKDAEYLMQNFVLTHPESNWKNEAVWNLGNYNFNRRDYDDALYWFKQVDGHHMTQEEKNQLSFKIGFSAFEEGDFDQAKSSFYELKDVDSEYKGPSNYYYGHIAYTEGNYQTSLDALEKASEDPNFAPVVPYYITQIYHFQEKYDELIAYASPMMDDENTVRKEEIAHLLGNAHYQKQDYAAAVPYLQYFADNSRNYSAEDAYQIAYALYRTGAYQESIDFFAKAVKTEDVALEQVATYQMADAYLNLGEKNYAQNAFKIAAQNGTDPEITEDAFFNYAKLAYELSYDPFHEAIKAFEYYIENYPNSERKDEAYEFLLKVYISTKNYTAALEAIDKMKAPNAYHKSSYQECAYNLGVGEMRKAKNDKALTYFADVKKYPVNPKLIALSTYWEGDIYYRKGEYSKAVSSYKEFLSHPSAYQTEFYNLANYNIGYCHFKTREYPSSLTAFRSFVSSQNVDEKRKNDAYLRIGDLNLVAKNYGQAISNYGEAMNTNGVNGDYALFQIAQSYGYQDNYAKKIETLNQMFKDFPSTSLAAVGQYELGDSYFIQNELDPSLNAFNTVIQDYPQSPYRKKSLLKRGLVQYRKGDFDPAIESFKTVVSDYGVDAESNEAIATLKNIYLDLGKVDEYSKWLSSIPNYEVSVGEIDSLTYQSAENLVAEGDCDGGIASFEAYLSKYPNGLFTLNANYYLADCAYRKNDYEAALKGFSYVMERPVSQFSEPSFLGAATIYYEQKSYDDALNAYTELERVATFATNVLEAQVGQMRCAYKVGNYEQALAATESVLADENTPEKIAKEALLTEARIHFNQKEYEEAKVGFEKLAANKNSVEGAEAKYRLAEIAYFGEDLDGSESHIFALVQDFSDYQFWKVKAFILLSDVYVGREDFFQARATLQSVLDNITDEGLVAIAEEKMAALEAAEQALIQQADTLASPDTLDYEESYKELIEEEEEKPQEETEDTNNSDK